MFDLFQVLVDLPFGEGMNLIFNAEKPFEAHTLKFIAVQESTFTQKHFPRIRNNKHIMVHPQKEELNAL